MICIKLSDLQKRPVVSLSSAGSYAHITYTEAGATTKVVGTLENDQIIFNDASTNAVIYICKSENISFTFC